MDMRGGKAFTLIEIMVTVAIAAIVFAIATSTYMQFGGLQRQVEYDHSLTQSSSQLDMLREADFESLPPETRRVEKDQTVKLARDTILESSIVVRDAAGGLPLTGWTFEPASSKLRFEQPPSQGTVVVEYEFFLGSQNLTQFSDSQARIKLPGGPGFRLEQVSLAEGDKLETLSEYRQQGEYLQLPTHLSNKLIVLDYYDEEGKNKVSGSFLDANFQRTTGVTATKLIEVQEPFAGGWKMSLPLLKEQKP